MKRLITSLLMICGSLCFAQAQYFFDNFETYTAGSYLGNQSSTWTTWSGSPGGSDDVLINNAAANSGSKSIYFYSASGGGPHDVVLPFGGVHSTGRFKFSMMMYIPSGKEAYFNFQAGAFPGSSWAMEFYLYGGGTFSVLGYPMSGTYPQGRWFELTLDCNLDTDVWQVLVDGVSKGTFTNTSSISYLDLFEANSNSEFWIDDVFYCVNNACNPELKLDSLRFNPTTVCTHAPSDITFKVTNNSSFRAERFMLGVDVGSSRLTRNINLNNLGSGRDTTITISGFFSSPVSGSNIPVKAINLSGDINAANDTAKSVIQVLPSPSGTQINRSTPFQSPNQTSTGEKTNPDIVTAGDQLTFEIAPPNGFNNSNYGTSWNITALSFVTSGGVAVSNSMYTFTAPSGSSNARITFSPTAAMLDSSVFYSFEVNNLSNGCDSVLLRYIEIVPRPQASFSQVNVCDKEVMNFTNGSTIQSGNLSFFWKFGDGNTSTQENPDHLYAQAGTYTVTLYATSGYGYVDSMTTNVQVFQLPTADFGVLNACQGTALSFTDRSSVPNGTPALSWNFGDGTPNGSGLTVNHLYNQPGIYEVTMTITVNGCSDTKSRFATQAPRAVPSFNYTSLCNNREAVFTNTTQLVDGTFGSVWKFGDGQQVSAMSPSHIYSGFGNFPVTLVVRTDLGCVDSVSRNISLLESPKPDFTLSSYCSGEQIQVSNLTNVPTAGVNTYYWNFGDGNTSTNASPVIEYSGSGTYTVSLVVNNSNGCADSITRQIKVDIKPIAHIIANEVCEGEPVHFVSSVINVPDGVVVRWDFGGSAADTLIYYANPGVYPVKLFATTPNGCVDTATYQARVFASPDATFTVASAQKGDGTMSFSGPTGSGYSYQWFLGDGAKYAQRDFDHRYPLMGNYTVRLVVTSSDGCISETSQMISVNPTALPTPETTGIKVYPNPASEALFIDLSLLADQEAEVIFYTSEGRELIHVLTNKESVKELDVRNMAAGTYILRVVTNQGAYAQRIVLKK